MEKAIRSVKVPMAKGRSSYLLNCSGMRPRGLASIMVTVMCLLGANLAYAAPPAPCTKTNSNYIPSGGGQSLIYDVVNRDTGELVRDGDVVPAGTRLTMNFIAAAYGECNLYYGTRDSCQLLSTSQRRVHHIYVGLEVESTVLNGSYASGQVYGRNPSNGTTAFYNVLDSRNTSTSTGPVYSSISSTSPGTYRYNFTNIISVTNCNITPSRIGSSITVFARSSADDENLGCAEGYGGANIGNPCNAATGNKYQVDTDLTGPVMPLVRHYNSKLPVDFGFGMGWTTAYHKRLERSSSTIRARRGDGKAEPFSRVGPSWAGESDSTSSLVEDPFGYTLTLQDRTVERYDLAGRMVSLTDRNGNVMTLTYESSSGKLSVVRDAWGRALSFSYGADGRATSPRV